MFPSWCFLLVHEVIYAPGYDCPEEGERGHDCFEYSCAECDECGAYVEEDDLEYWGDDMRLCPGCFEKYFPPYDEAKNLEETTEAYEAMLERLVGKKTDQEEGEIDIETEMDEDSFQHSMENLKTLMLFKGYRDYEQRSNMLIDELRCAQLVQWRRGIG